MLKWSINKQGNYNGKRGPYTLFVLAFHAPEGWWLHPKLPGLIKKSILVESVAEGQQRAKAMCREWFRLVQL